MKARWRWVFCCCIVLFSEPVIAGREVKSPSDGAASVIPAKTANRVSRIAQSTSARLECRGCEPHTADGSARLFVSPNIVNMLPADRQPLQLLDADGGLVEDVTW